MRGTQFEADASLSYERGNSRSQLYDASTIFAKHYPADRIPNDELLTQDIDVLLQCLETYLNLEGVLNVRDGGLIIKNAKVAKDIGFSY